MHYENVTMVGNNVTGNNVYYLPFRFRLWKRFHQEADGCSQKHWNHNRKLSELGVRQFFNATTTRQLFRFLWHDKKYDNYLPAGVLMEWLVSIQYWTVMWQAKIFGLRIGSDWSDCVARAQLWKLWPENSFCSKFTGCLLFIPLAAMWTFLSAKNLIFKKL